MKPKKSGAFSRFSKAQIRILRCLETPRKVQDFLDYELDFNGDPGDACLSPLGVLEKRKAHCIEGAMFAAAAFLFHGRPSMLLDLRANLRDDDHVIAPFRENGRWGAVAQSHFCGLRYREPIYASTAELAKSYFEFYYNDSGEKTLREFSVPLYTSGLDPGWLHGGNVSHVSEKLDAVRHYEILGGYSQRKLRKADSLLFEVEILGSGKKPLSHKRPRPYSILERPAGKGRFRP